MQTVVPLYGFGGGGGVGASLTVIAPVGCTVTVSKEGKTKTKVADDAGTALFKGLEGGEWTVTITDGTQTARKTVTITADYAAAMSFFAATINVTYPAGSTCTANDGVTTITAPDTSGTWACVVPNAGMWTVSLDIGFSETVSITQSGQTIVIDKWHLFRDGDQCAAVTGGWEATPDDEGVIGGTLSFSDGEMVLVGTNKDYRVDASCKSLDSGILARFTKVGVHVTYASGEILAARIVDNLTNKTTVAQVAFAGAGDYSLLLDGISEGQIIVLAYNGTLKVTKIWLE